MSLRRISDEISSFVNRACMSPEHDPPNMVSLSPGTYEWTCPACGHKQVFTVDGRYCQHQHGRWPGFSL